MGRWAQPKTGAPGQGQVGEGDLMIAVRWQSELENDEEAFRLGSMSESGAIRGHSVFIGAVPYFISLATSRGAELI